MPQFPSARLPSSHTEKCLLSTYWGSNQGPGRLASPGGGRGAVRGGRLAYWAGRWRRGPGIPTWKSGLQEAPLAKTCDPLGPPICFLSRAGLAQRLCGAELRKSLRPGAAEQGWHGGVYRRGCDFSGRLGSPWVPLGWLP